MNPISEILIGVCETTQFGIINIERRKRQMSKLIPPHGGKGLTCCLLEGAELDAEKKKAEGLKKITLSPRAKGDLIMIGIGDSAR